MWPRRENGPPARTCHPGFSDSWVTGETQHLALFQSTLGRAWVSGYFVNGVFTHLCE